MEFAAEPTAFYLPADPEQRKPPRIWMVCVTRVSFHKALALQGCGLLIGGLMMLMVTSPDQSFIGFTFFFTWADVNEYCSVSGLAQGMYFLQPRPGVTYSSQENGRSIFSNHKVCSKSIRNSPPPRYLVESTHFVVITCFCFWFPANCCSPFCTFHDLVKFMSIFGDLTFLSRFDLTEVILRSKEISE